LQPDFIRHGLPLFALHKLDMHNAVDDGQSENEERQKGDPYSE
jgi:hypothetical protein